jgi:Helix-turn-helix domain
MASIGTEQQHTNLTIDEAAERLRLVRGTLNNWRVQGRGPRYLKVGKRILYPVTELAVFELANLRVSTTQSGEGVQS